MKNTPNVISAESFIEKVNNGQRNFENITVEGVVDLDLINCGPEVSLTASFIRVYKYEPNKHIGVKACVFLEMQRSRIPY